MEEIIPPITTVASGLCTSAPVPVFSAIGTKPRLATKAVIKIGLNLVNAPFIIASSSFIPSSCKFRIKETITIAKFVLWQAKEKYLYDVDVKYHDINYDFYDAYQELKSFCKNTPKFDTYSDLKDNVSSVVVVNEFNNDRLRLYNQNEVKDFLSQENSISSKIKRFLGC